MFQICLHVISKDRFMQNISFKMSTKYTKNSHHSKHFRKTSNKIYHKTQSHTSNT